MGDTHYRIDALQYANWSEKIFRQMREGGIDAVHVTIAYHENFRETVANIEQWNGLFERFAELIFQGKTGDDVRFARKSGRLPFFTGSRILRRWKTIFAWSKYYTRWALDSCN